MGQRPQLRLLHVLADVIIERGHHLRAALFAGGLEQRRKVFVAKFWRPIVDRLFRVPVG
jgi:hypothetical protein